MPLKRPAAYLSNKGSTMTALTRDQQHAWLQRKPLCSVCYEADRIGPL